nr:hypothetical protein [candidate division Zixibacteria bacterium]
MSILKNTFLASVGIFNLTRKKAEEIIDALIKAGEIPKSERKEAVLELLDRAEKNSARLKDKLIKESGTIQTEMKKVGGKIKEAADKLSQKKIMDELERLNKKIDSLARKIEKKNG